MSQFQLDQLTKTKILDVVVLSQKNRQPDDNPGMKISVEQTLSNETLVFFDGRLKGAMYTKAGGSPAKQGELEGVAPVSDAPNLTSLGQHVGRIKGDWEWTGCTFTVDRGLGGKKSDLEVTDCTLSGFKLQFKEGGSYVAKYNIESPDASEAMFGKFAKLKSREVESTITPPTSDQREITDKPVKPPKVKPTGHEAGDEFAKQHAGAAH